MTPETEKQVERQRWKLSLRKRSSPPGYWYVVLGQAKPGDESTVEVMPVAEHRAALEAVEAERDEAEQALTERDEIPGKVLDRLERAEKQLAELREAIRDVRLSRTDLLSLATQPDTENTNLARMEEVEYPGLEMVDESFDTASQAPRCGGRRQIVTDMPPYKVPRDQIPAIVPCPGCPDCTHKDEEDR